MDLSGLVVKMIIFVVLMVIGYVCAKTGVAGAEFTKTTSKLVINVFMSATIINSVLNTKLSLTGAELGQIMLVLSAALVLCYALAALAAALRWVEVLLRPLMLTIKSIPVASFIILALMWLRRAGNLAVFISFLMVLPVVWENLSRGLEEVDGQLLEMGRAYRFTPIQMIRLIYLPSLRPYFLSAITTAMGLGWKSGAAAEVLCLPKPAIGTQIYNSKLYLEIPDLFAWTVVVVALSMLLEKLLRTLLRRGKGGNTP